MIARVKLPFVAVAAVSVVLRLPAALVGRRTATSTSRRDRNKAVHACESTNTAL